ncbi:transcriptional regulator [Clostridium sardiniense]|uniref:Transcriptional regulator n=1 Tax=Clostridium sardiniense TaxID=29369 RepID=A0ABS7L127_CLOSR|nr:transcriptional regulator [Clostridium sardiniense]MBY0756547.1 transcriptional regulator [Clostridium sardiniense]MDQ0460296.1 transcriptional regulator with XRE-family HTH domain [Clostridium sardiniense]
MELENTSIRLKRVMKERNLRQVDLLEMLKPFCKKYNVKINKSDISQYLSGKVKPGQEKLSMLGMALNLNETWLMGYDVPMEKAEITNNISNYDLSKEEQQHIDDLRNLNDIGRKKVIAYTKDLLDNPKYALSNNNLCAQNNSENSIPYLVACHDDNLSDDEKKIMDERIAEYLNKNK